MAPVHKRNIATLDNLGASKKASMTSWDRTLLNNREARVQGSDDGGFSAWWSIVPMVMQLRITPHAFRQAMSVTFGRQVASLEHGLHGRVCPCRRNVLIDHDSGETHALSCTNAHQSRVHHCFRDHAATMMQDANVPLTTVTVEPRGPTVGREQGDRKGTDILVVSSVGQQPQAMGVKPINVSAITNQENFRCDQQQLRQPPPGKTNVGTGNRNSSNTANRSTAQGERDARGRPPPIKTVQKIIDAVNAHEDAILATGRGIRLTCVPVTFHGAIHGNYVRFLHELIPAPGDPGRDRLDQQHAFGWSCPDFRSYALQSASVAILNEASAGARHAATLACRRYNLPEPDRTEFRWQCRRAPPTDVDVDEVLAAFDAQVAEQEAKNELSQGIAAEESQSDEVDVHQHQFTVREEQQQVPSSQEDGWF